MEFGRPIESKIEGKVERLEPAIDRGKVCPFLLRVFCSTGKHNSAEDYKNGAVPQHNECQIYTWTDVTLKELSTLIQDVNEDCRKRGTVFEFAFVTPSARRPNFRDVGTTIAGNHSPDDNRTLKSVRFVIGDCLDVAITPPGRMIPGRRPFGQRHDFRERY